MKLSFLAPRGALLIGASLLFAGAARAQLVPPSDVLPPRVVASGATVSIPVSTSESKVRLRLRNGAAYLDEETSGRTGSAVSVRLDAEPGRYLLRPFSPNKNGGLVGTPLSIVVPGLRREPGVWLFNGSMWIEKAEPTAGTITAFLANLRRDSKAKLPLSVPTPQLLRWQTLPSGSGGAGTGGAGSGGAGTGGAGSGGAGTGGAVIGSLVKATGEMNESAALRDADKSRPVILEVDVASNPLLAARQLENAAGLADAIVLKFDGARDLVPQLWPLKMARRMAEETPGFDLPIFADISQSAMSAAQLLEVYQNGATGFLVAPGTPAPAWVNVWDANSNWLTGAVTLEDMGVLNIDSPRLEPLLADLRAAGRIPLVGQLPGERNARGESNMVLLDDSTTEATLDGVNKAARAGNTVYLEGLPAPALYAKMGEVTGTSVTVLSAPRDEILTLNDPWTWGAISGREYAVRQRVSVVANKSLAAQTKEQKGKSIETISRPTGKLTGDPNGWMVCPVGKGRIFWAPHSFSATKRPDLSSYYAAVAGGMQSALIELDGERDNIRVALRATQGQAALLALFNAGNAPAKISVGLRGGATYVLDLMDDTAVPNRVIGFETGFEATVPAGGYRWLALAGTSEDLDKERAFKRVKARLK